VSEVRSDRLRSNPTAVKHGGLQDALLEVVQQALVAAGSDASSATFALEKMHVTPGFFVTDDYRVLRRRAAFLHENPPLVVVTLEDFFEVYQRWVDWNS
jgi:hypothetical protein